MSDLEENIEDLSEKLPEIPTEEPANDTINLSDIEEAASKQGWKPDGELGALEFLSKGSHFRDGLHKEIADLREDNQKAYGLMAEHIHDTKTEQFESTKDTIEARIREASEAGDTDKVIALSQELANTKAPEKPADPKDAYIGGWMRDNSWFDENQQMGAVAKGLYLEEERKGVTDPETILPVVEAQVKKLYPEYFNPENPNRKRAPAGEGGGNKRTPSGVTLKRSDLTEDEGRHFDQFIKGGAKEETLLASVAARRAE